MAKSKILSGNEKSYIVEKVIFISRGIRNEVSFRLIGELFDFTVVIENAFLCRDPNSYEKETDNFMSAYSMNFLSKKYGEVY